MPIELQSLSIAGTLLAQGETSSGSSFLSMIMAGGPIGFLIIFLSIIALVLVVVHLFQLRESSLAPGHIVDDLHELLSKGMVDPAITYCDEPGHSCFLTQVMAAGLARYRRSPFGGLELKGTLEEAGQDQVARLYRWTDALALIATIAPMLGLLGTVVGINKAFANLHEAASSGASGELASAISLALVTTIMGLVLAIPATAAVTYFRNRIDSLASDIAGIIDDLAMLIEEEPTIGPARTAPVGSVGVGNVGGGGSGR